MRMPVALVTFVLSTAALSAQSSPALKIVVIEGEGGVNIIQQKTAVRPLIEVRDRNNLPVSGALVTFTIGGGNSAAFAGGAQTLTVTTDATGQAAASGLNAIRSGPFQIQVQAAYQGQVANASISLTNYATAAAAAAASAAAGAGTASGAAAGAAGAGGGLSATTIGVVGAAVAGGAVVATQVAGKSDEDSGKDTGNVTGNVTTAQSFDGYDGTLSGQFQVASLFTPAVGPVNACTYVRSITGTIRIELSSGNATGRAALDLKTPDLSVTGNCFLSTSTGGILLLSQNTPVSGGPSALTFSGTVRDGTETVTATFQGSLSGNTITGTIALTVTPSPGANPTYNGGTTINVTLQGPRR
jgi:hypothetical protein